MVECKEALVMSFSTGISIGAFIDKRELPWLDQARVSEILF